MKLRINIASPGRFHVLDLARELTKYGHEINFYSYVPTQRALRYGLPAKCNHSFLWILAPFLILMKIFPRSRKVITPICNKIQDYLTGIFMRPCDVCIVMSEAFVFTARKAKQRDAIVIIERGSKHGYARRKIMDEIDVLRGIKPYHLADYKKNNREEQGYAYADYVAIPADHVLQSFKAVNFPVEKLFTNPYGVDVSLFKPSILAKDHYDVLMVGGWSYRKGCDLLGEVCAKMKLRLLHVGGQVDCPFPDNPYFTHIDPVDQMELPQYYKKGKIFCLPSREEGLALVLIQALASGLPIVCSKDSGGRELWKFIPDRKWIIELAELTEEELKRCLSQALTLAENQSIGIPRSYCGDALKQLTWEAYGCRYNEKLQEIMLKKIGSQNANISPI